jgi:hypothetical protein
VILEERNFGTKPGKSLESTKGRFVPPRAALECGSPSLRGESGAGNNGLFNGTKPIYVENKGSLEEQTQTKPISEACVWL